MLLLVVVLLMVVLVGRVVVVSRLVVVVVARPVVVVCLDVVKGRVAAECAFGRDVVDVGPFHCSMLEQWTLVTGGRTSR